MLWSMKKLLFLLSLCAVCLPAPAQTQQPAYRGEQAGGNQFFRLATGGLSGNYYPIGGLLAQGLSNPIGGRPCAEGGACGVPGLVVYPLSANASLANIRALETAQVEGALVQSDAAFWGYTGTALFNTPHTKLRFVATLFTEQLHLVTRADSKITSVRDLRGHLVGVGLNGSGTLENVKAVLSAAEMSLNEIVPQYLTFEESVRRLERGVITAVFFVAPTPSPHVADMLKKGLRPVAIDGTLRRAVMDRFLYFDSVTIPANVYGLKTPWETVGLGAQLLVAADLPDQLVYDLTTALWAPHTRSLLGLHPKGREVTPERALFGLAVPMHPGAARYYRERGLLTPEGTN
jgi:TRAP transporter TAXI family solute receptor